GLSFGVKDLFHIAGARTGFGQPDWLRTHPPASQTAPVVQVLLDAGADMVGKTLTDELAYSLTGENVHYGTPVNPRDSRRIPGGSSSGSASAVAGGLVDFALGTDCGGSVRLPASYCGVIGIRPTHGRVSLEGAIPFGPSFDVAGWLARDAGVFERVSAVLLGPEDRSGPGRLLVDTEAMALVAPGVRAALAPALETIEALLGPRQDVRVSPPGLREWFETFRVIQAAEVWGNHGAWVSEVRPKLGPGIDDRIAWASGVTAAVAAEHRARREAIVARIEDVVRPGDVLCLPTSPRIAPLKGTPTDKIEVEYRHQAMCLLCVAGLGGLPQISIPAAALEGMPLGLSLVGARG
ncbi:MAG: amidase, partial [Actinobacteria bacterium]|nr:amidase [Actinomycetota bacterium]NIW30122.1 amidase [Actinomycetota bacterium]